MRLVLSTLMTAITLLMNPNCGRSQGTATYDITGYQITRLTDANDSNYYGYVTLLNGNRGVAYLAFYDAPPRYGSYSANSDYLLVPFDIDEFDDLVATLRNEDADSIFATYDDQSRVTFTVLHSERSSAIDGIAPDATSVDSPLNAGDVKTLAVRDDVLSDAHKRRQAGVKHRPQCELPAIKIPTESGHLTINRVYFVRQKLFNLQEKVFTQVFFDFPKAVAVADDATLLGIDDNFYYFKARTFDNDREWAFSIEPTGSFDDHSIWSRRRGEKDWKQEEGDIVMADVRALEE